MLYVCTRIVATEQPVPIISTDFTHTNCTIEAIGPHKLYLRRFLLRYDLATEHLQPNQLFNSFLWLIWRIYYYSSFLVYFLLSIHKKEYQTQKYNLKTKIHFVYHAFHHFYLSFYFRFIRCTRDGRDWSGYHLWYFITYCHQQLHYIISYGVANRK